jgi:hypothetical protein
MAVAWIKGKLKYLDQEVGNIVGGIKQQVKHELGVYNRNYDKGRLASSVQNLPEKDELGRKVERMGSNISKLKNTTAEAYNDRANKIMGNTPPLKVKAGEQKDNKLVARKQQGTISVIDKKKKKFVDLAGKIKSKTI